MHHAWTAFNMAHLKVGYFSMQVISVYAGNIMIKRRKGPGEYAKVKFLKVLLK